MTLYWAAEIVSLWAALRLFGIHCSAAVVILGYATGHVLTPRSVPLAGVGVTEVLLTLALVSLGLPLARTLVAVLVYRAALLDALDPAGVACARARAPAHRPAAPQLRGVLRRRRSLPRAARSPRAAKPSPGRGSLLRALSRRRRAAPAPR